MAALESLIRKRLMTNSSLAEKLATFGEEPAIFLQEAPDDTAEGWGDSQYPRLVFLMDTFADAERNVMGGLSVDVICAETGYSPEDIEPHVREALAGVFFTPEDGRTFSPKWKETTVFKTTVGEQEALILGMSVIFDVYEFPLAETSDPDPIAAINRYAEKWSRDVTVIGKAELSDIYLPSCQNPAMYFRTSGFERELETCSVVWVKSRIAAHLFAPNLQDRMAWLKEFSQDLGLAGEITMLDGSPMFIQRIQGDAKADEVTGQLTLHVRYGLLRRPVYAHTMIDLKLN